MKKIETNQDISDKNTKTLSKEEYVNENGLKCPFCHVIGPIEGSHSFEYNDGEASLCVVCTSCGKSYNEIYSFESWLDDDDDTIGTDIDRCPFCKSDISEEFLDDIDIDGPGILRGALQCCDCDADLSALLRPNLSDSDFCRHRKSFPIRRNILQIAPSPWRNCRHPTGGAVHVPVQIQKFPSHRCR